MLYVPGAGPDCGFGAVAGLAAPHAVAESRGTIIKPMRANKRHFLDGLRDPASMIPNNPIPGKEIQIA
jgi:hypothetical protein